MARILVSMPENFLMQVDNIANREGRTRSELVREALRAYFRKNTSFDLSKVRDQANLLEEMLK